MNVIKTSRRRRLVGKDGTINITQRLSPRQHLALLHFTSLVGASWSKTIFVLILVLISSWFLFAVIWWVICHTHGDFEPQNLPPFQAVNNHQPCVYHMYNFFSCLLFSIETQHTVGYGVKATTDECPEAIFVNAIQCIIGFTMQGIMAAIVFSKMTLPTLRSKTLIFSQKAILTRREKNWWFIFRMGDMRRDHITDVVVRVWYVAKERSCEGEVLTGVQQELEVEQSFFFNWPVVIAHKIGEDSPLVNGIKGEIVVVLEGVVRNTGQPTQARTSYLLGEIEVGAEFTEVVKMQEDGWLVDFSKFDGLEKIVHTF